MFELTESTIRQLKYHETIKEVLLVLHRGTQAGGSASVTRQLLEYVRRHHPRLWYSQRIGRLGFAGLTIALPVGYGIFLHPEYVRPSLDGAVILAHELGHALWNSHGFDSSEEEYYCDRVAGRAYQEMLLAAGASPEEAAQTAQARLAALRQSLEEWTAARRKNLRWHLLQPWTWFDDSRAADVASNLLLGPWINLGIWGYPAWRTRRDLGK